MKHWRFEVYDREGFTDVHGKAVLDDIRELGIDEVTAVSSTRVFMIDGDIDEAFAQRIAQELLSDTVCQECFIGRMPVPESQQKATIIEVHLKSGVTDPVSGSVMTAISDMGKDVEQVRTARKFVIYGDITEQQRDLITRRVLANDCIEDVIYGVDSEPPSPHLGDYKLELKKLELINLSKDQLVELSKSMDLFLDEKEMLAIQDYFKSINREPTDVELETLAQTWSEHCVHKTLKSSIDLDFNGEKITFKNLLKETVFGSTQELNKDWCISVFEDNAGVIEFDESDAICFKVETHNHPSALDPYGGASTGIGGVVRDPMGTGLGAKPIANSDVFCFGMPDMKLADVPKGVLHPRRVMKGVVAGVRDYGNRMGIPTVNGAIYFDDRYTANPLVFCGTVGMLPNDKCFKHGKPGDLVVVVGGRTGRDGIHGATFSSGSMTHEHEDIFSHAVQIGNAIVEKKVLDTLIQARDRDLFTSLTDCGAGGLSSAVGEMGEKLGVKVDLEKVPLKYSGLSYTEIWISEAQERMVISVEPDKIDEVLALFSSEDVEAVVIGEFTDDKKLTLSYDGTQVGQLDMEFLHDGIPKYSRQAKWHTPNLVEPDMQEKNDYVLDLKKILSSYNVASKEWVIRQYDHEVQGNSVIKPLCGVTNDAPSDAAVVMPKFDSDKGVAISCGMNPLYGDIDPYWMALSGIDEAIRNIVCVGGNSKRIALLDNFCWGNCSKPEILGALVRASQACKDGALAFSAPFISGKDSLNNEFIMDDGTEVNIPSTLLISAISIVDDVNKCLTMDFKAAANNICVVGITSNELGGSHYYQVNGHKGANVPKVDLELAAKIAEKISGAIEKGLVASAHDCSEGGLAVALAEMAFAGDLGVDVDLSKLIRSEKCTRADIALFSESNSRYVLEIAPDKFAEFEDFMQPLPVSYIGKVTQDKKLVVDDGRGNKVLNSDLDSLKDAWQKPLAW